MPKLSAFEAEMAIEKLKRPKSPGTDQIPAELIKAGDRTIRWQIHKLINSVWSKAELPKECRNLSFYLSLYYNGYKTDCYNYRGITLLSTTYKILSNILLSRLAPYAEEIIGGHQCGLRRNTSTTDHSPNT